jgi:hypothetical protein
MVLHHLSSPKREEEEDLPRNDSEGGEGKGSWQQDGPHPRESRISIQKVQEQESPRAGVIKDQIGYLGLGDSVGDVTATQLPM